VSRWTSALACQCCAASSHSVTGVKSVWRTARFGIGLTSLLPLGQQAIWMHVARRSHQGPSRVSPSAGRQFRPLRHSQADAALIKLATFSASHPIVYTSSQAACTPILVSRISKLGRLRPQVYILRASSCALAKRTAQGETAHCRCERGCHVGGCQHMLTAPI